MEAGSCSGWSPACEAPRAATTAAAVVAAAMAGGVVARLKHGVP